MSESSRFFSSSLRLSARMRSRTDSSSSRSSRSRKPRCPSAFLSLGAVSLRMFESCDTRPVARFTAKALSSRVKKTRVPFASSTGFVSRASVCVRRRAVPVRVSTT